MIAAHLLPDDSYAAVHESAHAVLAMYRGASITGISIVHGGGGIIRWGHGAKDQATTQAVLSLAGAAGEFVILGRDDVDLGWDLDLKGALAACRVHGPRIRPGVEMAFLLAETVVRGYRDAVVALADAVLQRRLLTGDEAWQIFRSRGQSPFPPDYRDRFAADRARLMASVWARCLKLDPTLEVEKWPR